MIGLIVIRGLPGLALCDIYVASERPATIAESIIVTLSLDSLSSSSIYSMKRAFRRTAPAAAAAYDDELQVGGSEDT